MADTPAPIDPDRILEHSFTSVRRGYDPLEVQRYLLQIANQLRSGRDRELELRGQLDEAEKRTAPIDDLDPSQLARLLGEETARVLEAAQGAAGEIRAKAEENVGRLLREARDESQQMREEAESVLSRKTAEADEAAAAIRAEAESVIEKARAEAAELVEAGRQDGRDMVAEAQKVRQRMLDDLSRRRKLLRQQIEQLQAGRDRLLAAYDVVRETLDVATEELHIALPEAKLAAETASLRDADDEASFEAEVDEAAAAEAAEAATATAVGVEGSEPSEVEVEGDVEAGSEEPAPADEATAPGDVAEEPTDTALGIEEPVGTEADDADALAPDPVEGRHSSSVRVVKAGAGGGDKAADVFARLREEDVVVTTSDGDAIEIEVIESALEAVDVVLAEEAAAAEAVEEDTAADDGAEAVEEQDTGPTDPAAELLVRRDAAVVELERNLARRLKRELSDEQNELLAALTAAKGAPTAADVLPAPEAHVERFQAIALPTLAAAATAGADLVSTVAGPPAAPTTVADLAAEVSADIVAPLRERLERAFAAADGHPDDVAQSIRSCYREWKGQRVDQIAAHAVVAACNRGLLDRLPEGTLVRWVVADGDSPSPDCEDNALAGAVVRGEPFPTGHTAPPLHASCRCMVVPADA
jgi:DivIVA domain-containing protein